MVPASDPRGVWHTIRYGRPRGWRWIFRTYGIRNVLIVPVEMVRYPRLVWWMVRYGADAAAERAWATGYGPRGERRGPGSGDE
jgi:hypothetical protein